MNLPNELVYMECPCGSGKKFKFCHFPALRKELEAREKPDEDTVEELVLTSLKPRGPEWDRDAAGSAEEKASMDAGVDEECAGQWKRAAAAYREAREAHPEYWPAWNAEAEVLWMDGDAEGALALQREAMETSDAVNATGWARLSDWCYQLDRNAESREFAERARAVPPVSQEGTEAVCRALARWNLHEAVAEYALASKCDGGGDVALFAGVALANLGRYGEAKTYLKIASNGCRSAMVPAVVLNDIEEREFADSLEESPPPPAPPEDPNAYFDLENYADGPQWVRAAAGTGRNVAADLADILCTHMLLADEEAVAIASEADPARGETLRAKFRRWGTQSPELADEQAALARSHGGATGRELLARVLRIAGHFDTVVHGESTAGERNRDPAEQEAFNNAVKDIQTFHPGSARWTRAKETFSRLVEKDADDFRAAYNLVTVLMVEGDFEKGLALLRDIRAKHPEYGHAAARTLQILCREKKFDEARKLVESFRPGPRMHAEEYARWFMAAGKFHRAVGDDSAADTADERVEWAEFMFGLDLPRH